MDSLVSRQKLLGNLECIKRETMYEERFRQGYLHCLSICNRIVNWADAVNPVEAAGGVNCWGCNHYCKKDGTCNRLSPPQPVKAQDFCSFGTKKSK